MVSLEELRAHSEKAPALEDLDGWVPVAYDGDFVSARKIVDGKVVLRPFKAEGIWKTVLEWLKKRERILEAIEKEVPKNYELVPEEEAEAAEGKKEEKQEEGAWEPSYSRKPKDEEDEEIIKDTFRGHSGKWVTLEGGQHIFIREGETIEDAVDRLRKPKERPEEDVRPPDNRRDWRYKDKGLAKLNPKDELVERAKKKFGVTTDLREAGYLLEDGSLLDFSGKREGGSPRTRGYDHREISRVIDTGDYGISGGHALSFFQRQANSIRYHTSNDFSDVILDLNIDQTYTPTQWEKLSEAANICYRRNYEAAVIYSIYDPNDNTLRSDDIVVEGRPRAAIKELRRRFDMEKHKEALAGQGKKKKLLDIKKEILERKRKNKSAS